MPFFVNGNFFALQYCLVRCCAYDFIDGPWAKQGSERLRAFHDFENYGKRFDPESPAGDASILGAGEAGAADRWPLSGPPVPPSPPPPQRSPP